MSFITVPGRDIVVVDESSIRDNVSVNYKIHLVRLNFDEPNEEKMQWVLQKFRRTNRYVIDSKHIRFYNQFLRGTNLKYYVINILDNWYGLISFFKRNNKVLLDLTKLSEFEKQFVLSVSLNDVLSNTEVILISKKDYESNTEVFNQWRGDIILQDVDYPI